MVIFDRMSISGLAPYRSSVALQPLQYGRYVRTGQSFWTTEACNWCSMLHACAAAGDPDHPGLSIAWGCCGHVFHLDCIQRWLKTRSACPLCNKEWEFAKIEKILGVRMLLRLTLLMILLDAYEEMTLTRLKLFAGRQHERRIVLIRAGCLSCV